MKVIKVDVTGSGHPRVYFECVNGHESSMVFSAPYADLLKKSGFGEVVSCTECSCSDTGTLYNKKDKDWVIE